MASKDSILPRAKATGLLRMSRGTESTAVRIKAVMDYAARPLPDGQAEVVLTFVSGKVDAALLLELLRDE